VYYVVIGEGNEKSNYFKIFKQKKCPIHHSYKCTCNSKTRVKNVEQLTEEFILIYENCSKLFTLTDGKLKFSSYQQLRNLKSKSKRDMRF